jgi:signal transduction histidine kinase
LALEESRRSFLRMVSHELRTPLNSIIGFSEIISKELYGPIGDARYRDHAQLVHESGLKLLKLVNDVLDIARLEAGAMDLDLRPEPVASALQEAVSSLTREAERRAVELTLESACAIPQVIADPRGLQTIFVNLIQNAIAQSPKGASVLIQTSVQGGLVVVEIADHGKGVPQEGLALMLRPVEQAESALVRRTDGAGLGLAIVGLLCEAMGGRFSVRSNPDQGLTAVVKLPIAGARGPSTP